MTPSKTSLDWPVRVYFYDTDAGGVVHNLAYLRMIETARTELARELGWPMHEMMEGEHGCPVVVRTEIDYLKPARLGDDLIVRARIESMEKVRFTLGFEITDRSGDLCFVRCRQVMASVDLKTGRPLPLRQDWRWQWPELCGAKKEK